LFLLAKEYSKYNEIAVYETTQLYGKLGKYRFLQFSDNAVQGAIDLKRPKRIVLEYPRAIVHLMECNAPAFRDVFMIGHGVGTIAGHYPDKRFTIAEIDEKVVELSRRYFQYTGNNVVIGDGRELLMEQPSGSLDYIVLDAFTPKGTPLHLTSAGFFRLAEQKLYSRGALLMNLTGKGGSDRLINAIHSTLGTVFAFTKAFVLHGKGQAEPGQRNMILIGSKRPIRFQAADMAGFVEVELEEGHTIMDNDPRFAD